MAPVPLPHNDHTRWSQVKASLKDLESNSADWKSLSGTIFPVYNLTPYQSQLTTFLAARALEIEVLFPHDLTLLHSGVSDEVVLSQRQCLCLLSHAFFGTFADCAFNGQTFTFRSWKYQEECIKCFMEYVSSCKNRMDQSRQWRGSQISICRRSIQLSLDELSSSKKDLSYVSVAESPKSTIEGASNCFHADFANAYIGGGVLSGGYYQEEIRFLIAPECLLSILFCEKMEDNESILIRGAEQFSSYTGFGDSFQCSGPYGGPSPTLDDEGFLCTFVVAMDATPFDSNADVQYGLIHTSREIVKCAAALDLWSFESLESRTRLVGHTFHRAFATGNWGCGAFGGNPQYKFLLQWLVASYVGRDLVYFPFNDERMAELGTITTVITQRQSRQEQRVMVSLDERGGRMVMEERGGAERDDFLSAMRTDRGLDRLEVMERYSIGIEDSHIDVSTLYQWVVGYESTRLSSDGDEESVFDYIARKMRNE